MTQLADRAIVVTGAFGALGAAVVARLAAAGARLACLDRADATPGPGLRLGGVDLADEAACRAALSRVAAELGPLSGLVNVAGGFDMGALAETGPALWDRMYQANLRTALAATHAALPHFAASGGRIVNIGAAAAARAGAAMGAYAASKSGVARLTESLAEELRPRRIAVNAVLPTIIDTPANRAAMPDADPSGWAAPADIAEVIVFLLSDQARAVSGALIATPGAV
jgi:NAD(P)-dependent dehydrogenase (short-subunit alcohol dehydrogenase family)